MTKLPLCGVDTVRKIKKELLTFACKYIVIYNIKYNVVLLLQQYNLYYINIVSVKNVLNVSMFRTISVANDLQNQTHQLHIIRCQLHYWRIQSI